MRESVAYLDRNTYHSDINYVCIEYLPSTIYVLYTYRHTYYVSTYVYCLGTLCIIKKDRISPA